MVESPHRPLEFGKQIAQRRQKLGYSQEELSHISGVSLRTIQRIEKQSVQPRGYTRRVLAESLQMEHSTLSEDPSSKASEAMVQTRTLNTLGLLVILLPLISCFIQIMFWKKNQSILKSHPSAKKIVSFQMVWIIILVFSLAAVHVLTYLFTGQSVYGHFPIRLVVYSILLIINVFIILHTAIQLNQNSENVLSRVPSLV